MFPCASVSANGINFQACLIDRSSISPFRINGLRAAQSDYRKNCDAYVTGGLPLFECPGIKYAPNQLDFGMGQTRNRE